MKRTSLATILLAAGALAASTLATAQEGFSVEKTPSGGALVKHHGKLITEYVVDQANKPYLWPIVTPAGVTMTRAYPIQKVEGEQWDHPHHRGIFFGHESINGADSWAEKATFEEQEAKKPGSAKQRLSQLGAQRHVAFTKLQATTAQAELVAVTDYLDATGQVSGQDERRITFEMLQGNLAIDFDITFTAGTLPVTFADKKDAGLSIRVPTSMAVDTKQGGHIVNSDGITDKDAWAKRAKWCDYSGPVQGQTVGVAIFNHSQSFRFPTSWHVRTYGLFTANAFGPKSLDKTAEDGAFTLKPGETVKLRHRFLFHDGDAVSAKVAEACEAYLNEP
ncbi:MAG: PmoA family protein [Roseimicrobium sp.]